MWYTENLCQDKYKFVEEPLSIGNNSSFVIWLLGIVNRWWLSWRGERDQLWHICHVSFLGLFSFPFYSSNLNPWSLLSSEIQFPYHPVPIYGKQILAHPLPQDTKRAHLCFFQYFKNVFLNHCSFDISFLLPLCHLAVFNWKVLYLLWSSNDNCATHFIKICI